MVSLNSHSQRSPSPAPGDIKYIESEDDGPDAPMRKGADKGYNNSCYLSEGEGEETAPCLSHGLN